MKMAEHDSELAKGHCEWKIPWHKRKKKNFAASINSFGKIL